MNTTLSLRIYKNEIAEDRLKFIRKSFTVAEESEKVLTVEGEKETICTLFNYYLSSDADFKAAFPEYMTYTQRVAYTEKMCRRIKDDFAQTLCNIINNGAETAEFARLRDLYLNELR